MTIPQELRRHRLDGTFNLRDVGGYRTPTGRVRWNRLLRSDALHRLTPADRALLAELRVARVVDLRDAREVAQSPSRLAGLDVEVCHVPVFADAASDRLARPGTGLVEIYRSMVQECGANLVAAVRAIATADLDTVLVHCTAGKDRTGVVAGLTLLAVGVDRADVLADYAASEANLDGEWAERTRADLAAVGVVLTPEIDEVITASPAALLDTVLTEVEQRHGSAAGYLLDHGLTPDELDRLRAGLVEPERP